MRKLSLQGGNPVELCDAPQPRGGSWGEDGDTIAALNYRNPLSRIHSDGGVPQSVTELREAATHRWPQVLPGAQAVVFTANRFVGDFNQGTVEMVSLKTGERSTLVRGGYYGRYVASGHLLYVRNGTVYAAPLDVGHQRLTGQEVPVVKSVRTRASNGAAVLDVSRSGTLLYAEGRDVVETLAWLDGAGRTEPLRARASQYGFPFRFSPDGTRLALGKSDTGNRDVWIYDWRRDAWSRLTSSPDVYSYPVWSPDGNHIAFLSGIAGSRIGIFWKRSDGAGEPFQLRVSENLMQPFSFSPNGRYLAFDETDPQTKGDLWLLPVEDARSDHPKVGTPVPFLKTRFNEVDPMIAPDGRWIAYQSDESGRDEIYVQPFPGGVGKWPVSTGGGSSPVWAKNTQALFYRGAEGLMVVPFFAVDTSFAPGAPKLWAAKRNLSQWFDISPGKRFVIIDSDSSGQRASTPITFVLNFFDDLRRLLPDRK